jgi:hypothetical protein
VIRPFLLMEVLCSIVDGLQCWHNLRPGGAIRGKWIILDENDSVWSGET